MKEKSSLLFSIREPGIEFVSDLADLSLGEIAERICSDESIVSNIPFIRYGVLAGKIAGKISSLCFIRKYACFIGPILQSTDQTFLQAEKIAEIESNKKKLDKITEMTLISIESYKEKELATFLGRLFVRTFRDKIFTVEEYNLIMFSLDLMHPYIGVSRLCEYYDLFNNINKTSDKEESQKYETLQCNLDYSPLATTCLISLPIGGSYCGAIGGATINSLGIKFIENVIRFEES